MSQISNFEIETFNAAAAAGNVIFVPQRLRDGIAYMKGTESGTTSLNSSGVISATASVRAGKPADLINGTKRIKRKFLLKGRLPVTVPGVTASGAIGDVVDYIDVEFVIAAPIEATQDQLLAATSFGDRNNGPLGFSWVEDMLIDGLEPF